MKQNEGIVDGIIRSIIAIVLFDLAFSDTLTGPWRTAAWILAILLGTTAMVSTCPLYSLLGFSTSHPKKTTR